MIISGQFSPFKITKSYYSIKCYFQYDIIYIPDGCEANALAFVLQSNNKLNIEPITEAPEYKLGFNRSYLKINNLA